LSLSLIKLAYTSVPTSGMREASDFKLESSHAMSTVKNMQDIPMITAGLRKDK
jgi:hypothetical protein